MWPWTKIKKLEEGIKNQHKTILDQSEKIERLKQKHQDFIEEMYIGKNVICRDNNDGPLLRGKCIRYISVTKANSRIPIVRNLINGQELAIMGIMKLYSEELHKKLKTMSPAEQWNYLAPNALFQRKVETNGK